MIHGMAEHKKATFTSLFGTPVRDVSAVIMVGARGGLVFSAVAEATFLMGPAAVSTNVLITHAHPDGLRHERGA